MINFGNVTKVYPNQNRPALESVNIEVAKGEFVFLVGPSGSGKSTFLRLVLKEERPTDGRIHVAGRDLARLSNWKVPYLRRRIGCVFQDFRLLPNKNVYQNVKDVRTGMENGNAVAVLDGEIDDFIDAEIRWMRQNGR